MQRGDVEHPRIGTAGWGIPKEVSAAFPGEGSHLERYSAVMSAAEINSSFHRPHRRTTYERWAASVPADFRFAVKLPKAISHDARLVEADGLLDAFLGEVVGLGERLGVVLVQLPPSFAYDETIATRFLAGLRKRLTHAVEVACEPRHVSWFSTAADACLVEHRVARVVADPVIIPGGDQPGGWPGLRYHRLHGAPRVYYSSYGAADLEPLAMKLSEERQQCAARWCIFDNTASGAAAADALTLQAMLETAET